jgi:CubicO group peptidase (beta-lactamase class C family)
MRRSRPIAIRFLAAVACGIASAMLGSVAAADGGPDLAAIDRYVRSEMDAQRIPGLALGIVHGDRIVHVQGFGQADKSGPGVTSQTPFLIGSVTKSFTTLAIMQLSEAGRVQLDAPVQRYLPWWRVADPDASTRVTVRHLLYQVSGLSKATGNAYATSGDTHATWYGFPVATELPFDRGGLGAGGLSSSAQDMARYLSLYLNDGRFGAIALVSPAGAAELQRPGVPTGLDGVSYAMGWTVSRLHGVPTISHDGSDFGSHQTSSSSPTENGASW